MYPDSHDYNITVPVRITNYPANFTSFRASCEVAQAVEPQHPQVQRPDLQLANLGTAQIPLTGGGYIGDVTIHMPANPGYDPSTGQIWSCHLTLYGVSRGAQVTYNVHQRYPSAPLEFDPPAPIRPESSPSASGIFPQS